MANEYITFKRNVNNATTAEEVVALFNAYNEKDNPAHRINEINKQIVDLKQLKKTLQAAMKADDSEVPFRDIAGARLLELLVAGDER